VGIKILNLEVERLFLSTPFQEEIKQLEEQINGVAQQIAQLEENIKILLIKEKFLQSIAEGNSTEAWKQIISGAPINFQNWPKTLDFLGQQLANIS